MTTTATTTSIITTTTTTTTTKLVGLVRYGIAYVLAELLGAFVGLRLFAILRAGSEAFAVIGVSGLGV